MAFCETRGDWKFLKEVYGFVRNYNKNQCCERCRATKKKSVLKINGRRYDVRAYNFKKRPGWMQTLTGHSDFLKEFPRHRRSGMCFIPGWHFSTIRADIMHTVNLGTAQWAIASAVFELMKLGVFGRKQLGLGTLLKFAYRRFKKFARDKRMGHTQRMFTAGRFGGLQYMNERKTLVFKGKAWNTRCVPAWIAEVTRENTHLDGSHGDMRASCMYALAAWFNALEKNGPRSLDVQSAENISGHGLDFLRCYGTLAKKSREKTLRHFWVLKPKHHRMHHICKDVLKDKYSPRGYACWRDEDFVGHVKKIAAKVHPKNLSDRVLFRWRVRLGVLWLESRHGMLSPASTRKVYFAQALKAARKA